MTRPTDKLSRAAGTLTVAQTSGNRLALGVAIGWDPKWARVLEALRGGGREFDAWIKGTDGAHAFWAPLWEAKK